MVLDPTTNEPTRVGRRLEDGKLVRYSKKTGTKLIDVQVMEPK
jgi:large subunit ribosomal protein L24